MSNSGIALVFLLSDFRFVVIVTETTKLGLEHRHCRVKAKKKPKSPNQQTAVQSRIILSDTWR